MEWLDELDFNEIRRLRDLNPSQEHQNLLAGHDRRAFTRGSVNENPLWAGALAPVLPLELLIKKLTGMGRSQPTLEQLFQGYKGIGQGLQDRFNK